jgi:hypothetical protein
MGHAWSVGTLAQNRAHPIQAGTGMQLLESTSRIRKMRRLIPILLALSPVTPASAVYPQLTDGEWMCDIRDTLFRLTIEGATYRYTDPASPERSGNLAPKLDGTTYIVSGFLREAWNLTRINYRDDEGGESLELSIGDLDTVTWIGGCFRPQL